MFRFTIRDVLWLTTLVAMFLVWWLKHGRMSIERSRMIEREAKLIAEKNDADAIAKGFQLVLVKEQAKSTKREATLVRDMNAAQAQARRASEGERFMGDEFRRLVEGVKERGIDPLELLSRSESEAKAIERRRKLQDK